LAISRAFVDWLECTLPTLGGELAAATELISDLITATRGRWRYAKPLNGYKFAVGTDEGALLMTGRLDMGAHLALPGKALTAFADVHFDIGSLVVALAIARTTYSRIDCALDVTDGGLDIFALRDSLKAKTALTRTKTYNVQESQNGGLTLYIGSWHSERFARIYNKAAELSKHADVPDTSDWVRIEVISRNDHADNVARAIIQTRDVAQVVRGTVLAFVDFPFDRAWRKATTGTLATIGRSKRAVPETDRWLLGPVITALARRVYDDPAFNDLFARNLQAQLAVLAEERRRDQLADLPGD
jgi:hypothetical protein